MLKLPMLSGVDVVNRLKRNVINSIEELHMIWKKGLLQQALVKNIGTLSISQICAWVESREVPKNTPLIFYLQPKAV